MLTKMFEEIRDNISDSVDELSYVMNDIDISYDIGTEITEKDIENYIDEITIVISSLETVKENLESLL